MKDTTSASKNDWQSLNRESPVFQSCLELYMLCLLLRQLMFVIDLGCVSNFNYKHSSTPMGRSNRQLGRIARSSTPLSAGFKLPDFFTSSPGYMPHA